MLGRHVWLGYIVVVALFHGSCATSSSPLRKSSSYDIQQSETRPEISSPFEDQIRAFELEDQANPPQTGGVVFVGGSSIRRWTTLSQDFPHINPINRGIDGSTLIDLIRYADRIILKYQPQVVVISAGEDDIATSERKAECVLRHFQTLVDLIHRQSPDTRILYISMKPSPGRNECLGDVVNGNRLIRGFISTHDRLSYIDVIGPMLDENGNVRQDFFTESGVHLSNQGYRAWASAIRPYVDTAMAQR